MVVGHVKQMNMLKRAVANGTWSSSYVFHGVAGIGKFSTAIAFAQMLNCRDIKNGDRCQVCGSCKQLALQAHPDLVVIRPENRMIKMEQIKTVLALTHNKPVVAQTRIVVIDSAECLNKSAANALLKTLEEPHPGTVFILICENVYTMIETVVSRTVNIAFSPLTVKQLREVLGKKAEEVALEECGGSVTAARNFMTDDYCQWQEKCFILLEAGIVRRRYDHQFFSLIVEVSERDLLESLNLLVIAFRDVLVVQVSPERVMFKKFSETIHQLATTMTQQQTFNCINYMRQCRERLVFNPNHQSFWEGLLCSWEQIE